MLPYDIHGWDRIWAFCAIVRALSLEDYSALVKDKTPLANFVMSFFESGHEDVECFSLLEFGGGVAFYRAWWTWSKRYVQCCVSCALNYVTLWLIFYYIIKVCCSRVEGAGFSGRSWVSEVPPVGKRSGCLSGFGCFCLVQ